MPKPPECGSDFDDATLAEWEQDIEQALRPSSLQQGAMWTGAMAGHLREAIEEIRRLRDMQGWWDETKAALAAHRAVVRELAETLEESDEPGQAQEEECACWRARKDAALAHPLVVAARKEKGTGQCQP